MLVSSGSGGQRVDEVLTTTSAILRCSLGLTTSSNLILRTFLAGVLGSQMLAMTRWISSWSRAPAPPPYRVSIFRGIMHVSLIKKGRPQDESGLYLLDGCRVRGPRRGAWGREDG